MAQFIISSGLALQNSPQTIPFGNPVIDDAPVTASTSGFFTVQEDGTYFVSCTIPTEHLADNSFGAVLAYLVVNNNIVTYTLSFGGTSSLTRYSNTSFAAEVKLQRDDVFRVVASTDVDVGSEITDGIVILNPSLVVREV